MRITNIYELCDSLLSVFGEGYTSYENPENEHLARGEKSFIIYKPIEKDIKVVVTGKFPDITLEVKKTLSLDERLDLFGWYLALFKGINREYQLVINTKEGGRVRTFDYHEIKLVEPMTRLEKREGVGVREEVEVYSLARYPWDTSFYELHLYGDCMPSQNIMNEIIEQITYQLINEGYENQNINKYAKERR